MAGGEREAIPGMVDLLRRQSRLYRDLESLGKKQQELVAVDDTRPLLKVLAQRQRLTGELLEVGKQLKPLRAKWDEAKDALPADTRSAVEKMLDDARTTLARVIAADAEDANRLQIRKQRTGAALSAVHANRKAVAAYAGAAQVDPVLRERMHEDA